MVLSKHRDNGTSNFKNLKFSQVMLKDGFMMIEEDHCVYIKHSNSDFIIMSLYVDGILIV